MKKYGLMFAGILVLTFSLSFSSGILAEEGGMHEMMEHGKMGMEKAADDVVVDPVCGMKIIPEEATGKSEYKGKTYYFCMDADKKTFDSDPEKYIAKMEMGKPAKEMDKHHEMEGHGHNEQGEAEKAEHQDHNEMKGEGEGHEAHHEMHWMAPSDEAAKPNPVESTEGSLAKAAETFKGKCAVCHGETGAGDGVLAESLNPEPRDLTGELTRSHSDGDLFWKITKGKGAMPAWEATLSEEDRWGMVNFIRSLNE